jgi:Holliday junction resolvasome RuvABC endonuclease subunit
MRKAKETILGISIGTQSIGFAVLRNGEIVDWWIKYFKRRWSDHKLQTIVWYVSTIVNSLKPTCICIKTSTPPLGTNVASVMERIISVAKLQGLEIKTYTIKELKQLHCKRRCTKKDLDVVVIALFANANGKSYTSLLKGKILDSIMAIQTHISVTIDT